MKETIRHGGGTEKNKQIEDEGDNEYDESVCKGVPIRLKRGEMVDSCEASKSQEAAD